MTDSPFDLLDAETARVGRFFDELEGDQWRAETRCPGWNRKDMAAHLIRIEDYIRDGLDDTVGEHMAQAGPGVGYERLNDLQVERYRGTPVAEVVAEWRGKVARQHARLRERGADGTIGTAVGAYSCGRQTHYFANEYAIHADDMGVVVPEAERAERLRWRLAFTLDALDEYGRAEVAAEPDGYRLTAGGESVWLSGADLVEAAAGRLPADRLPDAVRAAVVVMA